MPDALQIALQVAYRCGEVTAAERDAVLEAMASHLPHTEAEAAASLLHHRREAAASQLHLDALLSGIGAPADQNATPQGNRWGTLLGKAAPAARIS